MIDLYGFPHTSRVFYLKGTLLDNLYNELKVEEKYPFIYKWIHTMRS